MKNKIIIRIIGYPLVILFLLIGWFILKEYLPNLLLIRICMMFPIFIFSATLSDFIAKDLTQQFSKGD